MRVLVLLLIGMFAAGCGVAGKFKVGFTGKSGNEYSTEVTLAEGEKGVALSVEKDGKKYMCSYMDKKEINGEDDVVELVCLLPTEEDPKK
jgi:hypothetical protein